MGKGSVQLRRIRLQNRLRKAGLCKRRALRKLRLYFHRFALPAGKVHNKEPVRTPGGKRDPAAVITGTVQRNAARFRRSNAAKDLAVCALFCRQGRRGKRHKDLQTAGRFCRDLHRFDKRRCVGAGHQRAADLQTGRLCLQGQFAAKARRHHFFVLHTAVQHKLCRAARNIERKAAARIVRQFAQVRRRDMAAQAKAAAPRAAVADDGADLKAAHFDMVAAGAGLAPDVPEHTFVGQKRFQPRRRHGLWCGPGPQRKRRTAEKELIWFHFLHFPRFPARFLLRRALSDPPRSAAGAFRSCRKTASE